MEAALARKKEEKEVRKEKLDTNQNKGQWEKPTLEDISLKIMAQPYIRFT